MTAVATEGGAAPVQVMDIGSEIRGSALDPRTGTLWLATEAGLIAVTADAQGLTATARGSRELASVNVLAYDAATDRLVAGFADSVIALDREGGLRTLAVRDGHFELLAGSPFHLLPRVSLIRPPEGASLAESRPEIELYVEALCNDLPCEVPPGYLAGLRLTASLGDRLISEAFRFDPGRGRATAVTPSTLAEGENRGANRFTARATDAFGHESAPIDTAWTLLPPIRLVDSTKAPNQRPVVAMTAPADGARFVPGVGITLSATAADSDGTIAKVEFYRDGSTLLGTSVANPYALVWSNVAAGTYSLAAKATDNKGATTTSAPVSIVVAPPLNSPPTIVIDAPGEGTTFPAGGNLTLTASASDTDGTIARLEFYDGASLLGSVTGGASALTASWAVASLASGAHTLKATAIDNAGAGASATVRVQATAAPLVVITQPAACLLLEAPADVTLQADAFGPDVAIAQVAFYRGATLIGVATKEPYAVAWNGIAAGTYQVTAKATDTRGVVATSTAVTLGVAPANASPTVTLTAPNEGAAFPSGASIVLAATASDADGTIARVEFFNGGTMLGAATAAPYGIIWSNAVPGNHTLTARATDDGGATGTSAGVHITVVNAAPNVALIAPASETTFPAPATISVAATASDSDGSITSVTFFAGSIPIGTATAAPYAVTWSNVAAGTYVLTARAIDDVGATTTSAPVGVTVSANTPPNVVLTAPANGAGYAAPAVITLAASAGDADGYVTKVDFFQAATLLGTATSAPYTMTWSAAPAGNHVLTARATDNLGATATSVPVAITVSANGIPAVALTAPVTGSTFFAPATIVLAATASDSDGITRLDFYQGTTLLGSATAAPYTFVWDQVPAGSYSFTAVAIDTLGATARSPAAQIAVAPGMVVSSQPGLDGSTVADDVVLFRGFLSAPPNSGVSVNGRRAQLDADGNFYVNMLPLAAGSNTIEVVAMTQLGQ
ncbi:MAG: Ig-like domain-containing protein, partial [Casimicrobiaceae bacterium]